MHPGITHGRQYHVLVVVFLGAGQQESGGSLETANNPEVSLVDLTNHILWEGSSTVAGENPRPWPHCQLSSVNVGTLS